MTSFRVLVLLLLAASLGCVTRATSPAAERRIAELERENAELKGQVETLGKRLEGVVHTDVLFSTICPPAIEAMVLDVKRDLNLVVLNKGKKDDVKVGYVFDVYLGSTYKGQVRIQDVQEGMSSGLIINEVNPIARGDSATTSL
jgi:hypothetical protein